MLQVNPYLRPSAKQLLANKVFDPIRIPNCEKAAHHKVILHSDINEYKFNYETNQVDAFQDPASQKVLLTKLIIMICHEKDKLNK